MVNRRSALDLLGLKYAFDTDVFQWLSPTHAVVITVYVCYIISVLTVVLLRHTSHNPDVERLLSDTVADLRRIRYRECVRLLLAHVLLPLEKFGVFCGLVVGLVYWSLTLPVCLVVIACYTLPIIYVTGRLLINTRCRCLSVLPVKTASSQSDLSDGVTSFESCCFLHSISGSQINSNTSCRSSRLTASLKLLYIGLTLVALIWSLLLPYAEAIGFAVDVFVMTSLGVVLNSGSDSARRVVLVGCGLVYIVLCYRAAVGTYTRFSDAVFAAMKRRVGTDALRQHCGRNTAFKYYTADDSAQTERSHHLTLASAEDSIEYQSNRLHWKITSLGLFVDHTGTAHVPRDLFNILCHLDIAHSPKSAVRVIMSAVGRLLVTGVFLLVLGLVVEVSSRVDNDSISQTVVTLTCAAIPLVIHIVITRYHGTRHSARSELFDAKLERAILRYTQSWPVFDFSFQRRHQQTGNDESMTSRPEVCNQSRPLLSDATELKSVSAASRPNHAPVGSRDVDPSHVDLLITIRDDAGAAMVKPTSGRSVATERDSPLGSDNSCFARQSPVDEATGHQTGCSRARPHSDTADEPSDHTTLLLRKQNSASAIPTRNQMKPEVVSGSRTSSSTLVVNMLGDDDVTAMAEAASATRSLPARNKEDEYDDDDAGDVGQESVL